MNERDEEQLKGRIAELEAELARAQTRDAENLSTLRRYREVLDAMDVGLLVSNARGVVVDVNRRALELMDREADDVIGRPAAELFAERERARFEEETRRALETGGAHAGFTLLRSDQSEVPVEARSRRADTETGALVSTFFEDVTTLSARARRRFEEGPSHAVGMLCEGIAHQFNNLLARVMACAEDADDVDMQPALAQNLRTIINTCVEGSQITEGLLSCARRRPLWRRPVNPVNILEHTIQMLESELIEAGIDVTRDYQDVPEMMLDNVQIGEVFTNLIRNARDAMPEGGRLSVSCGVLGEQLVVRISDTGLGMTPEYLDRIFLPFVGTKGALSGSDVPGMGLGLSICQGIIASHHGDISAESTPGVGTTFTIRLPLEQEEVPGEGTESTDEPS